MIKLLNKYRRWHDFYNIKAPEVYISLALTAFFVILLQYIDFYNQFNEFSSMIQNILLYLIAGMLGLIGVALSGVAIITGLFSKENVTNVERINGKGTFENIMSSFLLLAMGCGLYVLWTFALILIIESNLKIADIYLFYPILIITVYFSMFNIFYTISLVANCIKIFSIRNKYDEIKEKTMYNIANEIRIDYILSGMINKYNISIDDFLNDLEKIVNESNIENKEELLNYYYRYYTGKVKK